MKLHIPTAENPFCGREAAVANFCGNEAFYENHLVKFIQNYSSADKDISALISSGNIDEAIRLAHSVKGLSRSFGMLPLGDAAQSLELSLKSGADGEIPRCLDAFGADGEIPRCLDVFSAKLKSAVSAYHKEHSS